MNNNTPSRYEEQEQKRDDDDDDDEDADERDEWSSRFFLLSSSFCPVILVLVLFFSLNRIATALMRTALLRAEKLLFSSPAHLIGSQIRNSFSRRLCEWKVRMNRIDDGSGRRLTGFLVCYCFAFFPYTDRLKRGDLFLNGSSLKFFKY